MDKETYTYWLKSAEMDLKSSRNFFQSREYAWSLFVGHLAIEKLLKSFHAKLIDSKVPYKHNLVLLAQKCQIRLTEKQLEFLDELSSFNIGIRYPDARFQFRKKCTKAFAERRLKKIRELAVFLKSKIQHG